MLATVYEKGGGGKHTDSSETDTAGILDAIQVASQADGKPLDSQASRLLTTPVTPGSGADKNFKVIYLSM